MRNFITWFLILAKRQLLNPIMLILLILIPVICIGNHFIEENKTSSVYNVGIYFAGEDSLSTELTANLLAVDDTINFTNYTSMDMLYKNVQNGTLISGIILPDNFSEVMASDNYEGAIYTIRQPSNTIQAAIDEIVYANLIKITGRDIITEYADSTELFDDGDTEHTELLLEYYDKYVNGDETFHVDYETNGSAGVETIKPYAEVTFPFRGLLSVLVFLSVLYGASLFLKDREAGVFVIYRKRYVILSRFLYVIIPGLLFGASSVIGIMIMEKDNWVGLEIGAMLMLVVMSAVFTIVSSLIIKKNKHYLACIPVILLCCLIFCPIFIVTSSYIPAAEYIEKLFVPYYYLKVFFM